MLEIEFAPAKQSQCDCCGNTTTNLTRYVYRDGDAHAVYLVTFTPGHADRRISGLISLGEWGSEDATADDRIAFPFVLWTDNNNFNVSLVDAEQSPWREVTFFGRLLDRAEALAHPWRQEVFHITDHIVVEDQHILDFFRGH